MPEEWRAIEGYEKYQVSNYGRIKSFWYNKEGIIIEAKDNGKGYLRVGLSCRNDRKKTTCINGRYRSKMLQVHRIVASAFLPNIYSLPEINHIDGNSYNNNVTNLEWCNHSHNVKHTFKLHPDLHKGILNPLSKLTNDDVKEIYKLAWEGKTLQSDIAKKYNVTPSEVHNIKTGWSWTHITKHACENSRPHRNKLSEKEVMEIYNLAWSSNLQHKEIALKFNISVSELEKIKNGWTWTKVTKHVRNNTKSAVCENFNDVSMGVSV